MKNDLGIYIHLPFCEKKCSYCDFYSLRNDSLQEPYLEALLKELGSIELPRKLSTVYLGGGTPSYFKPLPKLLDFFNDYEVEEFTIEANPESVSLEKACLWKDMGINRVSMGVQSMNDEMLKKLGRIHDKKQVEVAVEAIKRAGIKNFNLDLIYAIDEDEKGIEDSLHRLIDFEPTHISTYELELYENRPLSKVLRKVDDEVSSNQFDLILNLLKEKGYARYEVSNFSHPGFESKHNLRYWNRLDTLGIGAGAHGLLGNVRTKHLPHIESYLKDPTLTEKEVLSEEDIAFEELMLGLRLVRGIDYEAFKKAHPSYEENIKANVLKHIENGNLIYDGFLRPTKQGLDLLHSVLVDLLDE
ncbi:radical SAM family heme chaperone HemW [Guggenheimella bovis]